MSNFSTPTFYHQISGEKLFWDNVNYNTTLSKRVAKCKIRVGGWVRDVTPAEVLAKLKELGLEITQRTLQRYEKAELIPVPKRGSGGRGNGKFTDYPPETVWEAYAANYFLHSKDYEWSSRKIAEVRKSALRGIKAKNGKTFNLENFDIIFWRLLTLCTKYDFPIEGVIDGGIGNLLEAIKKDDKEAIKEEYLEKACASRITNSIDCSTWYKHVEEKFNLSPGWEEETWPVGVANEPCPMEKQCLDKLKYTWLRDYAIYPDHDNNLYFRIYERKPGTEEWILTIEEKL